MTNKIYIGNLSFKITEDALQEHFGKYGKISDISLIKERDGRLKGFAFIEFDDAASAKQSVEKEDQQELLGRTMKVSIAKPRQPRTSYSRGNGGGNRPDNYGNRARGRGGNRYDGNSHSGRDY